MRITGRILANPNPIVLSEAAANILQTPTGTATILWNASGVDTLEVHVGSPAGPLFSRSGPGQHEKTASWIVNGTAFYLQDVSGAKPLTEAHTLDVVNVSVTISLELLQWHLRRLEEDLVLLYDTLRQSPIADRYWIAGSLLIGWAREGCILSHELQDGDFGYFREDRQKLVASIPRLIDAGFNPLYRYSNNVGDPVLYVLEKDWTTFEFFEHEQLQNISRFWSFGTHLENNNSVKIEMICHVPAFSLAPMEFLGRTWQKPDDHDTYLKAIYGNWKQPNYAYDYIKDDLSIVEMHPWTGPSEWPRDEIIPRKT